MRCFLVGKMLREKHSDNIGRMSLRRVILNKCTRGGGMALKQMKVRRDDLKMFFEGVAIQTLVQRE